MSTIKDVAAKAGVSTATISKILNHKSGISKQTTERVLSVMKELNYTPNARAASLARKTNRNIAFLARIDSDTPYMNPHMFDILAGASDYLSEQGYTLTLYNTYEKRPAKIAEEIINSGYADALIIHAESVDKELSNYLSRSEVIHIIVGHPCETRLCWIDTNHVKAGQTATEYLLSQGYRRIAFISDDGRNSIGEDRLDGFLDTMELREIPVDENLIIRAKYSIEGSWEAAEKLLANTGQFDAVITSNNLFAYGIAMTAERRGLQIPEEFALITFDRHPYTSIIRPMPTYVEIDVRSMGISAAEMLLKELSSTGLTIQSYATIPILVEGNTTPQKG